MVHYAELAVIDWQQGTHYTFSLQDRTHCALLFYDEDEKGNHLLAYAGACSWVVPSPP